MRGLIVSSVFGARLHEVKFFQVDLDYKSAEAEAARGGGGGKNPPRKAIKCIVKKIVTHSLTERSILVTQLGLIKHGRRVVKIIHLRLCILYCYCLYYTQLK